MLPIKEKKIFYISILKVVSKDQRQEEVTMCDAFGK